MILTNDQYYALSKMQKWYRKYQRQFIDISGTIGTGTWDLVQAFIDQENIDKREVMYLSFDQKQVLELASKHYHSYYIYRIIYNYTRYVDYSTLSILNPRSSKLEYEWKKSRRKKIDPKYKLIVVFDSVLMDQNMINDLSRFGLPVILLRDPILIPSPETYTFLREPNITLNEINGAYLKNPLVYFTMKFLDGKKVPYGNFDTVSVIPKKQLNLYNLKSSDMNITMSDKMMGRINRLYRDKILKEKYGTTMQGEKILLMNNLYRHRIINEDEKRLRLYMNKGLVGYIDRIYKHSPGTRYVTFEFRPEFYHNGFSDLILDRQYLMGTELPSRQQIPDEVVKAKYAYALTPVLARLSHWDKLTLIVDDYEQYPSDVFQRMFYTAITRCRKSVVIVL